MMGGGPTLGTSQISEKVIDDHLAVQAIIRSYQVIEQTINEKRIAEIIY